MVRQSALFFGTSYFFQPKLLCIILVQNGYNEREKLVIPVAKKTFYKKCKKKLNAKKDIPVSFFFDVFTFVMLSDNC